MTNTSLNMLHIFLANHQEHFFDEMRIADYGGTENINAKLVRDYLANGGLKNYHVLDFDNGIDLREPIKGEKFDLGICMDLLEHVSNPFVVAENIVNSLNSGAFLFVTAPFSWEIHGYPDDFWRFCPSGMCELFKEMEVEGCSVIIDSIVPNINEPVTNDPDTPTYPFSRTVGIFRKK